jgi:hypothetical protein
LLLAVGKILRILLCGGSGNQTRRPRKQWTYKQRTGNGQLGLNAGQNLALKWPQKDFERFPFDLERILLPELQEVVDAWEELPQALKDGILAIVGGKPKKAK